MFAAGDSYRFDMDAGVPNDGPLMTKTVMITLGAAAAYMVLTAVLMTCYRYRRNRRKQYLHEQTEGIYLLRPAVSGRE